MKKTINLYKFGEKGGKQNLLFVAGKKMKQSIFLLFTLLCSQLLHAQLAPVITPNGGFAIDGGLKANTPTTSPFTNAGDWFPGTGGSGGSVFDASAEPINSDMSGRRTDPYNSNDDIFTNGSKFNDYISSLRWFTNSAPDKNDINNALYHVARDAAKNQWAFIAGDRLSTNGTSYIDFEFLQGSVTKNSGGTFSSQPLSTKANGGGRTEGDIIISMEYTNGGSKPAVYIYQWKKSGNTWSYQLANVADLDVNAFAETNRTGAETGLLYDAFGSRTYAQYAFVEAGINVTYLINQLNAGDVCAGLNIQTLWIKTKASASSTAALKDFIDPIPVDFQFGTSSIDPAGPFCLNADAVQLTASPEGGTFSVDGVSSDGLFTPSSAGVGDHVISYASSGCSANITITVNPLASVTNPLIGAVCAGSTSASLSYTATTATKYRIDWNAAANTAGLVDVGSTDLPASPFNISIPASLAAGNYSGTIYVTNAAGCESAGDAISLQVNGAPTASAGAAPPAQCYNATNGNTFSLSGSGSNGNPVWTVQTNVNNRTVDITNGTTYSPTVKVTGGPGNVTLRLTVTSNATPSCGSKTSDVVISVTEQPSAPDASMIAPICTDKTFSVQVNNPVLGTTYTLTQPGNNNAAKTIDYNVAGTVIFTGLTFGDGYSVTATNDISGCTSAANSCGTSPNERQHLTTTTKSSTLPVQTITLDEPMTKVSAAPNPYDNRIRFSLQSAVSGQGTLELYDMLGQKLKTVFHGYVEKGQVKTIEYSVPGVRHSNLIYLFRVGTQSKSGILIGAH
jgi:hypothetical protein